MLHIYICISYIILEVFCVYTHRETYVVKLHSSFPFPFPVVGEWHIGMNAAPSHGTFQFDFGSIPFFILLLSPSQSHLGFVIEYSLAHFSVNKIFQKYVSQQKICQLLFQ